MDMDMDTCRPGFHLEILSRGGGAKAAITEVRGETTKVVIKQCRSMCMYDIQRIF